MHRAPVCMPGLAELVRSALQGGAPAAATHASVAALPKQPKNNSVSVPSNVMRVSQAPHQTYAFDVGAVGDNPASDVAGARAAGAPWVPVLVTATGVWPGPGNSAAAPADLVVDDVEAAVALALQQ